MTAPTAAEARALLSALTRALAGVAVLALAFTAVNVTLFATSRGVYPGIAILLDPMAGLALATVLYADARLAAWGLRPPRWSAALRWFTGIAATLMNTWSSIWPQGRIDWPLHADLAGIVLHGVPTALLILLTETIAAYRRTIAPLLDPIGPADPPPPQPRWESELDRSIQSGEPSLVPSSFEPPSWDGPGDVGPQGGDSAPTAALTAPVGPGSATGPADGDVWARAITIDDAVRAATGRPVSVWRLRSDLRIGPERARQIRAQLLTRRPGSATPP